MQRFLLPGTSFPNLLIYGTAWKAEETRGLVLKAFRCGYRSFDTAAQPKHYREDLVGEAIREILAEGAIERKDLFVGFRSFSSLLPFRHCLLLNNNPLLSHVVANQVLSSRRTRSDQYPI